MRMPREGQGSSRIILVSRRPDMAPPADPPQPAPDGPRVMRATPARVRIERERPARPARVSARPRTGTTRAAAAVSPTGDSNWTVRRLANGAIFSGVATVAGGLVFHQNFQLFGDNNRQLLAMGFGLFVVGMVILTLCLIGLAAAAVRSIVAGQGWPAAVILLLAPLVPLVALNMLGLISYAIPSLFIIIVAGGFTLAFKR